MDNDHIKKADLASERAKASAEKWLANPEFRRELQASHEEGLKGFEPQPEQKRCSR